MGGLLGAVLAVGVLLIWAGTRARPASVGGSAEGGSDAAARRRGPVESLRDQIAEAGVENVTPRQVISSSIAAGAVVGVIFLGLSRTWPIAVAFGCFAGAAPFMLVRYRARVRRRELRELWPDVVDNLASAVRAGLSLPEALAQVGGRGPEPLRAPFDRFARDYRASGRFDASLNRLKERLADPTGDRIVESLRTARDVGGSDLGRVLRTLAAFLREDLRTRAELEARQGWTVNAARLAVAAPWMLLAIMSLRSSSVQAFNAPGGWLVLICGAGACVVAYRLMVRLGRLPDEERVLR